jgi:hypothetical protein
MGFIFDIFGVHLKIAKMKHSKISKHREYDIIEVLEGICLRHLIHNNREMPNKKE